MTEWTAPTLSVLENNNNNNNNSSKTSHRFFAPTFNIAAASFVPSPTAVPFDPFDAEEDDINELGQRLISSNLLTDEEEEDEEEEEEEEEEEKPANSKVQLPVWKGGQQRIPTTTTTTTATTDIRDIWSSHKEEKEEEQQQQQPISTTTITTSSTAPTSWDSFEPYARGNEQEFDPTLQFYHGSLYDSATIQDLNKLSLELPSVHEATEDNVEEDMSTLQMMQTIFSDVSDAELTETLERFDYDVDRAIEALLAQKMSEKAAAAIALAQQPASDTAGVPKKRQVCRHFLAGECYRKDCWFVHDLQEKACKFWLQGTCLKGDSCEFSHHIDIQQLASKMARAESSSNSSKIKAVDYSSPGDYPALGSGVPKKKTVTGTATTTTTALVEDEFPSLASAAKIKKPVVTKAVKAINFAEAAKKKKGQPQSQKSKTGHMKRTLHTNATHKYSRHQLSRPVHIPWLETGSLLNSVYMKEREQAIEYGMIRNRLFGKATEYYLKGDGARAKLYSMEAKHYNRLMQEMHAEASQRIFESRSKHEAFIDLHGLHEDEAMAVVEERLSTLKATYSGIIYIVTGTGHHSGASGLSKKQSKLKPTVYNYLKGENYHFAETSIVGDTQGGIFAVEI